MKKRKKDFIFNLINRITITLGHKHYFDPRGAYREWLIQDRNKETREKLEELEKKYTHTPLGMKEYKKLEEEDFNNFVQAQSKSGYLQKPEIEQETFDELLSSGCVFPNGKSRMSRTKMAEHFYLLKMYEIDRCIIPAFDAALNRGKSEYKSSDIDSLEEWLGDYLTPICYDIQSKDIRLLPYPKERYSFNNSFEERMALEIYHFSKTHGIANVHICISCGIHFLWRDPRQLNCTRTCKQDGYRTRRKNKNNMKGKN